MRWWSSSEGSYLTFRWRNAIMPGIWRETEHRKLKRIFWIPLRCRLCFGLICTRNRTLTKFSWLRPQPDRHTNLLSHSVAKKLPFKSQMPLEYLCFWLRTSKTDYCLQFISKSNYHQEIPKLNVNKKNVVHLAQQLTQSKVQGHIALLSPSDKI